tara:strand:- start:3354 stop:4061 length:708 start_codon:yes stop_codon:yes gene_type:complete
MRPFAVPLTVAAVLFVLAVLPSFFLKEYAEIAIVLSNFSYSLPLVVSYYAQNFDFVLTILVSAVISLLYHSCKAFDTCFYLSEPAWETIDVTYSWYLLLTLVSFFALNKRFLHAAPLHVALIIWGAEAHCGGGNYDCRSYKVVVVCIYLAFVIFRTIRNPSLYDVVDVIVAMALFVAAASIYLFFNSTAGHTLWHVTSAIGMCFLITCFKDSPFHTLGLREQALAYQTIISRADI